MAPPMTRIRLVTHETSPFGARLKMRTLHSTATSTRPRPWAEAFVVSHTVFWDVWNNWIRLLGHQAGLQARILFQPNSFLPCSLGRAAETVWMVLSLDFFVWRRVTRGLSHIKF